ncbi:MAG: T9SS type A sorting domain-containing protein [Paludibacter sp.]|nr:T9SS type A sorting domain-containing protein [Paludibacter sp.]
MKNQITKYNIIQSIVFLLFFAETSVYAQVNTNIKLCIDSTNCYIIDNFRSDSWGNMSISPGYGSVNSMYWCNSWLGYPAPVTQQAIYNGKPAMLDGAPLQYTLFQIRLGNYNNLLGMLNIKDLYQSNNTAEEYSPFNETQVKSYLQLPTLPSVGKIILFVHKAYSSIGCVVESKQQNGSWMEVARFLYPANDGYISLDTLPNNKIVSQLPVTYRIRSFSYNNTTSQGYGPILGAVLVQKYKENDIKTLPTPKTHPYYPFVGSSRIVDSAFALITKYTESQWLDLVPTQAPRSLQFSPACVNNSSWTWDPLTPNQIKCDSSGIVFPNAAYPVSYASTKVMTGKIVKVPYNNTSKGVTYVQAQIDYQKTNFLTSNLPILGIAYQLTGNEKYARYVALALDKWANVVPNYFMTQAWNKSTLVGLDELNAYRNTIAFVQRASDHNGLTHEFHEGEILAFDRIYDSQALQSLSVEKGYDVRQHITNDLFLNIALWLKDQPTMDSHLGTNLVGHIGCMIEVAAICADSALKESIIDFVDRYYTLSLGRNYKRDGMYPESFSYHVGYVDENYSNMLLLDNYFKLFPPNTPVLNTIATRSAERIAFTKRTTQVQDSVAFPDGDLAPFDDTRSGGAVIRDLTKSYLLPAYSHAMLGDGTGIQQIQSNIGANDKANHVGSSMMNMTLYAFGKEKVGDIRYSRIPGRNFTNSVQAHNLVAVDQAQEQYYSSSRQVYGNDGHVFTNGYFTMFEDGLNGISATEVYSNTINPGTVTRYQRLQVLNTIDLLTPYLVDVFVVNGGKTHDYILNGSTQVAQTATSSLPLTKINKNYPLLPAGGTYTDPVLIDDVTNWYGVFRDVSQATSTGNWNVTFQDSLSGGLKIFAVDDKTPTIYVGTSPYPYRRTCAENLFAYSRPVLIERRIGSNNSSKSVFVHILEPYSSVSKIASVSKLPLVNASNEYVALSVVFKSGRKDVVLINLNSDLITGTTATQTIQTADSIFSLTGKIGLFTNIDSLVNGYLVQGSKLSYTDNDLNIPDFVYTGTITGVVRKVAGAAYNAFVTDAVIPEGDELKGKWISVRYGEYSVINPPSTITKQRNMNELFQIDGIKAVDGKTYILCKEDPQLQIVGSITTELMRPQRVFNGATTFKIIKSMAGVLSNPTWTHTPKLLSRIKIYPNPSRKYFFLQSETEFDKVEISTLTGVVLKSVSNGNEMRNIKISVADLPEGIYLCKSVFKNKISEVLRLVVIH